MKHLKMPSLSGVRSLNAAHRAKLIGDIAAVLKNTQLPPEAHQAGLTLIGYLARRMPYDKIDGRTTR
jgi:hypothetical protein